MNDSENNYGSSDAHVHVRPAIDVAHAIPTFLVAPVQLMRSGIGQNTSCTLNISGLGSCGSRFTHILTLAISLVFLSFSVSSSVLC